MLTGNIEKKIEAKAQHRATQQKIKGPSAYGAAPHGTLKFKVNTNMEYVNFVISNKPFRLIISGVFSMFMLKKQI